MDGNKRTLDGITFNLSDQGAEVFDKLVGDLKATNAKIETVTKDYEAKLADAKAEIDKMTGERDAAAAKVVTDADLDKLVTERAAFVDKARSLCPEIEIDGKGVEEIKRAVVTLRFTDRDFADKSAEYIDALFDNLDPPNSQVVNDTAAAINPGRGMTVRDSAKARAEMIARNRSAWKGAAAK